MFFQISWGYFFVLLFFLLVIYYAIILLLFHYRGMKGANNRQVFKGQLVKATPIEEAVFEETLLAVLEKHKRGSRAELVYALHQSISFLGPKDSQERFAITLLIQSKMEQLGLAPLTKEEFSLIWKPST